MTSVAILLPNRRLARRQGVVLTLVVAGIAALLYFEYRTFSRVAPSTASEPDTMCVAARVGLSAICR
jgi:hypothetical protein